MGVGEALLKAVCEHPDDDTPRLVYADWLDEHGDPARAEFIRAQIELARDPTADRRAVLEARERDLLAEHGMTWAEPFRTFELGSGDPTRDLTYRRGFVWRVRLEDEDDLFADRAAELFALAPVQRLEFWLKYSHEKFAARPELLRLTELQTDRAGFDDAELEDLLSSPYLRNLVRLDLIADDDNGHIGVGGLDLLARSTALPALRYLDLSGNWCNWQWRRSGDWPRRLVGGPLVSQLERLALASTFMTGDGVGHLVGSPAVANLRYLDLGDNYIGPAGFRALIESPYLNNLRVLDLCGFQPDEQFAGDEDRVPADLIARLKARFGDRALLAGE